MTSVSVVVVAYGEDPWLERCVDAVLASTGVQVDVVVVDNGDRSGALDRIAGKASVQVLRPGANTGFAGGCNLGAAAAGGDVLALINPDVLVHPLALSHLAAAVTEPGVGLATASLRLADDPERMNSAGNPVHYLGMAWAGAHGEPASDHLRATSVASASGACCALRRSEWEALGGFDPAYFAYHEDVELSLRCWQRGRRVLYVPAAVAVHHYEFGRNALKNYLLERNRWVTVLTVYPARLLVLVAAPLAALELLLLGVATVQGWLPAKLRGYWWLATHLRQLRARRRILQAERVSDRDILGAVLAARIEPTNVAALPGTGTLNAALAGYWRLIRPLR